jgi:peptidoglycan/xylan/chitin deacetylase (PgdA/CDA1 family)
LHETRLRNLVLALGLSALVAGSLGGCARAERISTHRARSLVGTSAASATSTSSESATSSTTASESVSATGGAVSQDATPGHSAAPLPEPVAQLDHPSAITTITGPRDLGVPMLMYHVVGDPPPGGTPFPDLYVRTDDFVAHMNYLSHHGYHAVTIQQVYDFWHGAGSLPDKPVVITFDDGFTSDFAVVAPLLKTVNWPATLFLIVGRHKPRMPRRQVQAMIDAGWELGSHTVTHEDLPSLSHKAMRREITLSRKRLSHEYGVPVNFFCYPSGKFNPLAEKDVHDAGYLLATTTVPGLARPTEPYTLKRVRILGGMGVGAFSAALKNAH